MSTPIELLGSVQSTLAKLFQAGSSANYPAGTSYLSKAGNIVNLALPIQKIEITAGTQSAKFSLPGRLNALYIIAGTATDATISIELESTMRPVWTKSLSLGNNWYGANDSDVAGLLPCTGRVDFLQLTTVASANTTMFIIGSN